MQRIAACLEHPSEHNDAAFETLVADGFRCPTLRPDDLVEVIQIDNLTVRRRRPKGSGPIAEPPEIHRLSAALDPLSTFLGKPSDARHAKLKIYGVDKRTDAIATTVLLEASATRTTVPARRSHTGDVFGVTLPGNLRA